MPLLPSEKRIKYGNLGISREKVEVLVNNKILSDYFSDLLASESNPEIIKLAANYLTTDVIYHLSQDSSGTKKLDFTHFKLLMSMLADSKITSRVAKDLLPEVLFDGKDPERISVDRNLLQSNSEDTLALLATQIISENEQVVREFKAGKEASLQYLVGQGMKISSGSANPRLLADILKKQIS